MNKFLRQSVYSDKRLVADTVVSVEPSRRELGTRSVVQKMSGGKSTTIQVTDECYDVDLIEQMQRSVRFNPDFFRDLKKPVSKHDSEEGPHPSAWSDFQATRNPQPATRTEHATRNP